MWGVMMVAMMLPSLVPMLGRYRQAVARAGETRLGRLTALVGVGYFFVWTVVGMAAYPLGVALVEVEMQLPVLVRAVPIAVGVVVLIAGALQFTAWKARHLACCREAPGRGRTLPGDAGTAWRHGLRLGLHCTYGCAGLTAILLVIGVMDLRAMAVVTAAITVERLAPAGERVARTTGIVALGAGLFLIARAAGLGYRIPLGVARLGPRAREPYDQCAIAAMSSPNYFTVTDAAVLRPPSVHRSSGGCSNWHRSQPVGAANIRGGLRRT
jgi:predicted metal-binding membrane protein